MANRWDDWQGHRWYGSEEQTHHASVQWNEWISRDQQDEGTDEQTDWSQDDQRQA